MIDSLSAVNVGRRFYNLMIKGKDYEGTRVGLFRKYKVPTALAITLDKKQKEMDSLFKLEMQMYYCHASDEEYISLFSYMIVVTNSRKHSLDYRQAKKDFKIGDLKNQYRKMYEQMLFHEETREYEK